MNSETTYLRSYTLKKEQIPPVISEDIDDYERESLKKKIKQLDPNDTLSDWDWKTNTPHVGEKMKAAKLLTSGTGTPCTCLLYTSPSPRDS